MQLRNLLLVAPNAFGNPKSTLLRRLMRKKAGVLPVSLATVAALTPKDIDVDFWDENAQGPVTRDTELPGEYDLVGVTGMIMEQHRVTQIAQIFRDRRVPVVIGGPGVSVASEYYLPHFDALFIGEAEYTWPRFVADYRAGRHRKIYRQVTKVDMADSPAPEWKALGRRSQDYRLGIVQTARGCPHSCEFCSVTMLHGRRLRHKPVERVVQEILTLEELGHTEIIIADDNFYAKRAYTKSLLRELIRLNQSRRCPLQFGCQITLDVAEDDEVLELLADANIVEALVGIESPSKESLLETGKRHNSKLDLVEATKKIQGYGINVRGSMIVGFDNDGPDIFRRHLEFVEKASLPIGGVQPLKAVPGSRLWQRLYQENRIFREPRLLDPGSGLTGYTFNIVPKQMTPAELVAGLRDLLIQYSDRESVEARLKGMLDNLPRRPRFWPRFGLRDMTSITGGLGVLLLVGHCLLTDWRTLGMIRRLVPRAIRQGPVRLRTVLYMISAAHFVARNPTKMIEAADKEIKRLGHLEIPPGLAAVPSIPDVFRESFLRFVPALSTRIWQELIDKERVEDVLVETVVEYLRRTDPSSKEPEKEVPPLLVEICEHAIAAENQACRVAYTAAEKTNLDHEAAGQVALADASSDQLARDFLLCVEQELWSDSRVSLASASEIGR
jgi:radical SAM superfamily enzyme YgiQ (UPF0313 family)